MLDGTSTSYDGDSSSSLFIWGAQFEVGSTASTYHRTEGQPYYGPGATPKGLLIEEARTNLVTESEDFGTTWTTTTVTVDTDEVLAPDGATSADFLEETTATSVHEISMASLVTDATSKHVLSCFVKAQDRTIFRIAGAGYSAWATGGTWPNAFFDLSTETVTLSSGHSAAMEDYGNGWYRCYVVGTSGSSPSGAGMTINVIKTGTTTSYTGEAGKGLYVWGAQLEKGDFLTSYIQTTGTTLTRNADVATMGPTTGGTELVTNGTFDTDTTGWDGFSGNRSNISVSSGQLVVDVTNASFGFVARTDVDGGYDPVVVPGRRYRLSADLKVNSGSGVDIEVWGNGSKIAGTAIVTSGTLTTETVDFTCPDGVTSVTLFVDNATPRATTDEYVIDNVSVRELYPFEQYNPAEGTLFVEATQTGEGSNFASVAAIVQEGAHDTDFINIYRAKAADTISVVVSDGGVSQANIGFSEARPLNTAYKFAASYLENSASVSLDGLTRADDTSATIPAVDQLLFYGDVNFQGAEHSGYIKRFQYYKRKLDKVTLQSLTSD